MTPHGDIFPTFCLRRMEGVEEGACKACFEKHPQLKAAYRSWPRCTAENLISPEDVATPCAGGDSAIIDSLLYALADAIAQLPSDERKAIMYRQDRTPRGRMLSTLMAWAHVGANIGRPKLQVMDFRRSDEAV